MANKVLNYSMTVFQVFRVEKEATCLYKYNGIWSNTTEIFNVCHLKAEHGKNKKKGTVRDDKTIFRQFNWKTVLPLEC
jgi:hypothetical protein